MINYAKQTLPTVVFHQQIWVANNDEKRHGSGYQNVESLFMKKKETAIPTSETSTSITK